MYEKRAFFKVLLVLCPIFYFILCSVGHQIRGELRVFSIADRPCQFYLRNIGELVFFFSVVNLV